MPKKKIFVSFDYEKDKNYKNLLLAWDANERFDFEFYNGSVDVAVNSTDATYIRKVIKAKIVDATCLLCIVGPETHKSNWVTWEIKTAKDLNKKLIAVKVNNSYASPSELLNSNASWAKSWTFESIKNAMGLA